jgi:uncharacterized protein YegP (UPF0339 family)
MTKFVIYRDVAGGYRWRLVARNGEKVAASEAYVSKQEAIESAQKVVVWASEARIVDETTNVFRGLGLSN